MVSPFLSVCICTADRPAALARTLTALAEAQPPRQPWELLVVQNRPGDRATQGVLAAAPPVLPLRIAAEPRVGLSNARNRAVALARGELLLFTDDDVSVSAPWLRVYEQAAQEHPDVCVFGGPIRPVFERARRAWIRAVKAHVPTSYAWLDPQGEVCVGPDGDGEGVLPYGANFALRARSLPPAPFHPRLGRLPGLPYLGGEETRLVHDLMSAGAEGMWLHGAPVTHRIDRARMTRAYQRDYWHGFGYSVGVADAAAQRDDLATFLAYIERRRAAARRRWRQRGWWRRANGWIPAWRDLARWEGRHEGFVAAAAGEVELP